MSEQDFRDCPTCPELKRKIDRIDLAILGPDGTGREGGLVQAVNKIEAKLQVRSSWLDSFKPVVIAVVSSTVTFLLTYGLLHPLVS